VERSLAALRDQRGDCGVGAYGGQAGAVLVGHQFVGSRLALVITPFWTL